MKPIVTTRRKAFALLGLLTLAAVAAGLARLTPVRMGRQPDGSFLVSSGQRIEGGSIAFNGRPIDLAVHPRDEVFAVLNKSEVLLFNADGTRAGRRVALYSLDGETSAGFRGLVWSPDGTRLFASTDRGHVQAFSYTDGMLKAAGRIRIQPEAARGNPVPGGMAITRDGTRLFVAAANRNAVAEVDLATLALVREYPVQTLPFEPRLSEDERTLVVSNWGGRLPRPGDRTAKSQDLDIVVDDRGAPASGTVSLIDRADRRDPARRRRHPPDGDRRRRRPGLRRQRDERLDQRDRPGGRHGRAHDPAALGFAAGARRHAQRAGAPRRDPLRRRRRRQRPGRDRPRDSGRSAGSATPGTSPRRSTSRATAGRPSCSTPRGTAR